MSITHSQVITLTGGRQSGVTTSLLEHVKKSIESNPGKYALLVTPCLTMVTELETLVSNMPPNVRGNVVITCAMSVDAVRNALDNPPEGGYCGVFIDDGYLYISHHDVMSLAKEYPLLDVVVGDSRDSDPDLVTETSTIAKTLAYSITNDEIRAIALVNGFKLKEQSDGTMDLNPYVYDAMRAVISAAVALKEVSR